MPTTPLPRIDSRDRRSVADRTPQLPITTWVHHTGRTTKVHTLVGTGGWDSDALHAAARVLGVPTDDLAVIAIQGGHR